MIHLSILQIFIILLLLKLLIEFTDYKYSILIIIVILFCLYLYFNNKLSLTSNISFDRNILETNIRNLKKSIEKLNALNNSSNFDKDIMIKYNLFVENSLILYANKLKKCNQTIDIIDDLRKEILNIASSYIITMQLYDNYIFYANIVKDIKKYLDEIFIIVSNKCANELNERNIPFDHNKYNINSSNIYKSSNSSYEQI
jgi:hypothetical protein